MRLDRAIVVAKKDLAEFRRNRYILASMLLMPVMVAVVLPAIYVTPLRSMADERTGALDLEFGIVMEYQNATISNATLFDAKLENVTIYNCVIQNSIVRNSTIANSNVNGSEIFRTAVRHSVVTACNLIELLEDRGNVVVGSEYVGDDQGLESLKDMLFNLILLLLIMIPVMIPTVTASYSFVGEKVNRSLEPLLATPATDIELLAGKSGSIFAISMGATWLSFGLCVTTVDLLTEPILGYYPLPNAYWIVGVLLLAPAMCLMSILTNVLISSRVNDVRVSQQIGGILVLPVLAFFLITMMGVLSTGVIPLLLFSIGIVAADAGILWVSLRVFRREEILVRWK